MPCNRFIRSSRFCLPVSRSIAPSDISDSTRDTARVSATGGSRTTHAPERCRRSRTSRGRGGWPAQARQDGAGDREPRPLPNAAAMAERATPVINSDSAVLSHRLHRARDDAMCVCARCRWTTWPNVRRRWSSRVTSNICSPFSRSEQSGTGRRIPGHPAVGASRVATHHARSTGLIVFVNRDRTCGRCDRCSGREPQRGRCLLGAPLQR